MSILRFLERASEVRVLVAGDCMLDAYVTGAATRISPEAPVPVVTVTHRRSIPGGAANVAANARSLGAMVTLGGVTGNDENAASLAAQLHAAGIQTDALIKSGSRPTTTKTRVTVGGHQIVRFDDEDVSPLPDSIDTSLRERCLAALRTAHACVISDYAKGVVSDAFCRWLIDHANSLGVPVVIDPKARDLARYRGAAVITPNLKEAAEAAQEPIRSAGELTAAARRLLQRIAPSALLITRGEDGMSLFEPSREARHLPALVNEVADVTGAGDTVVAALAVALGAGLELSEAAQIANIAASIAVSHYGTWAVRADELRIAGDAD